MTKSSLNRRYVVERIRTNMSNFIHSIKHSQGLENACSCFRPKRQVYCHCYGDTIVIGIIAALVVDVGECGGCNYGIGDVTDVMKNL
ncbi:Hypothetical predicted protein [Octopus vulgaris]|uniref:Uncharacterized protein n=1 Tax=Octopus vulgaris TaxID=6645 RepID=A0AA36F914_OCTVU|nr:Hypothetical predicted protein [Octopus vulgaris]